MTPATAKRALEARLERVADALSSVTAAEGLKAMLEFYRDVRVEGCDLAERGDMLLFQWGLYALSEGERVLIDITRQFIDSAEEGDEAMSQLNLTFLYLPDASLRGIDKGDLWCRSPTELASFEEFIQLHPATRGTQALRPHRVTLEYSQI